MSSNNGSYAILLENTIGRKKEKGLLKSGVSNVEVLKGVLLRIHSDISNSRPAYNQVLSSLDHEGAVEIETNAKIYELITPEVLKLLQPIPNCNERFTVYQDKEWLRDGMRLNVGDAVTVWVKSHPDPIFGKLRYKGEIPDLKGTYFGVELLGTPGLGTCDGTFRKKIYFTCAPDSAVFVGLHKPRKCDDVSYFNSVSERMEDMLGASAKVLVSCRIHKGDRVVWMSDNGPEGGVVKWVGILPDAHQLDDVTVGVEFDNPVGSGTGKYKNQRLFYAKQGHASLVPVMGLIKEDEFNPSSASGGKSYFEHYPVTRRLKESLTQCQNDTCKVESTTKEILEKLDVLQAQVKLQHARHKDEFKRTTKNLERRLDIIEGQAAKRNEAVVGIEETLKMLSEKWEVQLQLMSNFITSLPGNDEEQKLRLESVSSATEDSVTIDPSLASTAGHFGDIEFYLGKQDEQRFLRDIDLGNVPLICNDRNVMTSEDLKVGDHSLPPNKLTQSGQAPGGHTQTNTNEQNRRDHANIFSDQAMLPRVSDNVKNPENVRNIGHKNKNVTLSKRYLGDQLKGQFMRETSIATNLALSTQPLETSRSKNETALKTTELVTNENDPRQFKTPSMKLDNTASSDSYTMKPGSRRHFHSRKTMWLREQRERRMKDLLRQQREKEAHNLDFDVPEKTRNSEIWLDFLQHEIEQVKNKEVLGVHTVFCLDTSASMRQGMAWEQAAKFFRDFISGLEDTAVENGEIDDKIALVVFGRKTEIIQRLTSDFSILRETFRKIKLGGPTQMFGGLIMALAAIAATHTPILNDIWMFPRIILLSDGKPSDPELLDGPDVPRPECQQQIRSKVLNVVHRIALARVIVHCVPVGGADMSLLKEIAEKTDGKIYTPADGRYVGKRTINCKHAGNVLRHWNMLKTNRYLYIPKRSLEQIMDPAGSDLGDPRVPGFIDIAMLPQEDRDHILSIAKEAIKEGLWDGGDTVYRIHFEFSNPIIDFPPVGCRVRRGPDWLYENDDGDGPGTVIGHSKCRKTVCVEWDKTQKRGNYRYNVRGPVDVVTVNEPRKLRSDQLIATGCLVKRGKDWKYGDQDGVPGSIGVVLTVIENGTVIVRWENKKKYSYRIGDKDYLEICSPYEHSFDFLPSVDPSSSAPDFLTTEGRMLYDLSQPSPGIPLFSARNTNTRPRTKNKNSAPIKKETTKDAP